MLGLKHNPAKQKKVMKLKFVHTIKFLQGVVSSPTVMTVWNTGKTGDINSFCPKDDILGQKKFFVIKKI